MPSDIIKCPKCEWSPNQKSLWICSICNTQWNTFKTGGICPHCNEKYSDTTCIACGETSRHVEWYQQSSVKPKRSWFSVFFKENHDLPVTAADKNWVEDQLLLLTELIEPIRFKSFTTVTPNKTYFDFEFLGDEDGVGRIFKRIAEIIQVDVWEFELKYYSNSPEKLSENIVATPNPNLSGSWQSPVSSHVNNGLGNKEIWIEIGLMNDPVGLIAILSHELSRYKLNSVFGLEEPDEHLTALAAVAFGFGIFYGNSYFKFNQWTGSSQQGWQMQKAGYLPEQVIAYAMAYLAQYRGEDTSWKTFLNKTMLKYFDRSYNYIDRNRHLINWM